MKKVFLLVAILMLSACTAPDTATNALIGAGYTNIKLTGYSFFSCAEEDTFATGFIATGPTGKEVKGTVCSGILKGATIRID